jgi:hypothetical protein
VQSFCTSSRRPEAGRTRRRLGARPSLRWRSDSGHATRPAAGAEGGSPRGRRRQRHQGWWCSWAAAVRAAPYWRGVGQGTPGPGTRLAVGERLRLRRLRRGRSGSGMAEDRRRVTVRGWLREPSRPPSTRASRADHRPACQRPNLRQGSIDVARRAVARSHHGRVDGIRDGRGRSVSVFSTLKVCL